MGCAGAIVKTLMFVFNFLVAVCGIAVMGVGIMAYLNVEDYGIVKFVDSKFSAPPVVLMVIGIIIFLIAFCGCCGAIQENSCLITTYAVVLLALLIAEVALGIYAVVNADDLKQDIEKGFKDNFKNNNDDTEFMKVFHSVEKDLKCCGLYTPDNYYVSPLPDSCCKPSVASGTCTKNTNDSYKTGCLSKIKELISSSFKIIGGVAIGVAAILLAGIISACCLRAEFKR